MATLLRFVALRNTLLIMLFMVCVTTVFAQFGGGSGTEADPYLISTSTHLNNVRTHADDCFLQTADIDLNIAPYNQGFGWTPLCYPGFDAHAFSGKYDGNGFAINNLYINIASSYIGLFGLLDGAELVNINLQSINVTCLCDSGGLAGMSRNSTIHNCSASGTLVSDTNNGMWLGGLIGRVYYHSEVSNSHATVTVPGNSYLGGLIGVCDSSSVNGCFAIGNVTCPNIEGGGLIGLVRNSDIANSYALGNVSGFGMYVGGLVGDVVGNSSVSNCYARGNVYSSDDAGGLIGTSGSATVENCYSTGFVSGFNTVGGLIGLGQAELITNSYWNTQISGQTDSMFGEGRTTNEMIYPYAANTYVGWNFTNIWIADTTQENDGYPYLNMTEVTPTVATPTFSHPSGEFAEPFQLSILTETEFADIYYTLDGSDPTEQSNHYTQPIFINETVTVKARAFKAIWLPSAIVEAAYTSIEYAAGSGTEDDPYQIATALQLYNVRFHGNDYFRQTADIDLNVAPYNQGSGWIPIYHLEEPIHTAFSGRYDGSGFTISNLYINLQNNNESGLFASVNEAELFDINLQNINITSGMGVGGLAGESESSSIRSCQVSGIVDGSSFSIGGLIGYCIHSTLDLCNTAVNVTGSLYVGGLVGECDSSSVTLCSARGNVTSTSSWTGGLVGITVESEFNQCYSTCDVNGAIQGTGGLIGDWLGLTNTMNNCYATGNVSGQSKVGGLIGKALGGNTVNNGYSTGLVSGDDLVGGLLGSLEGGAQVLNSYWDTQTSGQSTSAAGDGRNTDEMTFPYAENTFTGWDYITIWNSDIDYTVNSGYPYLMHNYVPVADETHTSVPQVRLRNYPNPFHPNTLISFDLPKAMKATLTIYNLKGQKIRTLAEDLLYSSGENSITWNGISDDGIAVPSGVYLYKLTGDGYRIIRKMTLLK